MKKGRMASLVLAVLVAGALCTGCDDVSGAGVDTSTPADRPSSASNPQVPQWVEVARFHGDGPPSFSSMPDEGRFTVDVPIGDWKILWTCDASRINTNANNGTTSSIFAPSVSAFGPSLEDDVRWFSGGAVMGNCGHPVTFQSDAWQFGLQQIPTNGTLGPRTATVMEYR